MLWFLTGRLFRFGTVAGQKAILVMTGLAMVYKSIYSYLLIFVLLL